MSPDSTNPDVAIVGYGPVGAALALQLAHAGLRVVVLERSREPVELPRAVALDGEAMRGFQRIGLGETVNAILQPPRERDEVWFTNSRRERLFGTEIPKVGLYGWRDVAYFDQPELEALLREHVERDPRIDVRLGQEVRSLDQDDEGVTLETIDASTRTPSAVRARLAVGCDGASSTLRGALGIGWESLGYDQDWLVVDIVERPGADLPEVGLMQVCDPTRLTTYVRVKDPNRRWEFQLLPGETREAMLEPARIEALLDPWLPREHYTIRRAAVYQFHAATAKRWQSGRVLLAGDAAHQTPPFLGQGLNAGLRDALNLGWKIPLVLGGVCDDSLLASYEEERDAHARDLVEWAVAIGKLMETLAAREAGRPDPHPADHSAGYGQGRQAPPLRDGVLVTEQIAAGRPVGSILLQPRLREAGGEPFPLDERLGSGFAVVGRTRADLEMDAHARGVLERLGGRAVDLDGLERVEGGADTVFEAHPAVVVRPDRYLFGVVDEAWPLDRLMRRLGERVGLR